MNTVTEAGSELKACCVGAKPAFDRGRCIGSQCMAWRWSGDEFEAAQTRFEFEGFTPPDDYQMPRPDGDGWELCNTQNQPRQGAAIWWRRPWGDRRPGFCGRAEPRVAFVETNQ
jgi:hypothetical protein